MSFILSKVLWLSLNPGTLLFAALFVGAVLLWTRRRRFGVGVVTGALGVCVLAMATGPWLADSLERRFPPMPPLPDHVEGIVILGGAVDPAGTKAHAQLALGGAVERLTEGARLARRYPQAQVVFSGGAGSLTRQEMKEAPLARQFLIDDLGLDPARVVAEEWSRNTWENAVYSRQLVTPQPGQVWVLVTSAAHMPRAVGCFRAAGWAVVPWPVDYNASEAADPLGRLAEFSGAVHEWVGLVAYRLMGRSDAWFPRPDPA